MISLEKEKNAELSFKDQVFSSGNYGNPSVQNSEESYFFSKGNFTGI